jgi:formyl-CoA transferase
VDIFATQLLPRNYKKLGIDYETLKSIKPDIIWLGITGFGPESNEPAYDPILQARSGLMDLTGEPDGDPQYMGIPLPDMGTSMHAYALLMKALYKREATGKGSCINMSMFESSISWLTVPITMAASFGKIMTRRGNTHPFFSPASVFKTKDRYVYIATGNDRQWKSVVSLEPFASLDKPQYETNQGRNKDVENLNRAMNEITRRFTADELIEMFNAITVPIGTVAPITEVLKDPMVIRRLLYSRDPISGKKITLAPAPYTTEFLEECDRRLSFPPRFGEHNEEIYCGMLGLSKEELHRLEEKKII